MLLRKRTIRKTELKTIIMRFVTTITFLLLFTIISISPALAQSTEDVKNVDPNTLSDAQVEKVKQAMKENNLTMEQAVILARQRGATEEQINAMKIRLQESQAVGDTAWQVNQLEAMGLVPELQLEDSLGQELIPRKKSRIFGSSLFNNRNLTFEPSVSIQTPKDYEIGIGDQLIINIWGNSQNTYQLIVNKSGQILIPDAGPVYIAGMKFTDAEEKIKQRLTSIYQDMGGNNPQTFAQINIGQLRSIKINLVGEAQVPGTYTLPAAASVFNALYLSGGPDSIGSFRNIRVIRDNKVFKTIDIYEFLVDANPEANIKLSNEDIVFIPPFDKQVEVTGEFKRNGLFEMKEEESVKDLIRFVGGFTGSAFTGNIKIFRKTQKGKVIIDVPLQEAQNTVLLNGDSIDCTPVTDRFENRVTINGAVYHPGEYQWQPDLSLYDLIMKADSVQKDAFMSRGIITRENADKTYTNIPFSLSDVINRKTNILLQEEDVVTIKSRHDVTEPQIIQVSGEVLQPGEFDYAENLTLGDAIFMAGGFTEAADSSFIEVARRLSYKEAASVSQDLVHIYKFNISRNLELIPEDAAFTLKPFDRISIKKAPGYANQGNIVVSGEITHAGTYAISNRTQRISDLIKMAGGVTPFAFTEGAKYSRKTSVLGNEFMAINLKEILAKPGGDNDLFLRDGDELFIPQFTQTVKISGSVQNAFSVAFEKGKSLKYYIDKAGGFSSEAMKRKTYVKYANGATASTKNFITNNYPEIRPGSEIVVPQKPEKKNGENFSKWLSVASAFSSLAVAIAAVLK